MSVRKTRTRELSLTGELDVDLVPVESAAASEPKTPRVLGHPDFLAVRDRHTVSSGLSALLLSLCGDSDQVLALFRGLEDFSFFILFTF